MKEEELQRIQQYLSDFKPSEEDKIFIRFQAHFNFSIVEEYPAIWQTMASLKECQSFSEWIESLKEDLLQRSRSNMGDIFLMQQQYTTRRLQLEQELVDEVLDLLALIQAGKSAVVTHGPEDGTQMVKSLCSGNLTAIAHILNFEKAGGNDHSTSNIAFDEYMKWASAYVTLQNIWNCAIIEDQISRFIDQKVFGILNKHIFPQKGTSSSHRTNPLPEGALDAAKILISRQNKYQAYKDIYHSDPRITWDQAHEQLRDKILDLDGITEEQLNEHIHPDPHLFYQAYNKYSKN